MKKKKREKAKIKMKRTGLLSLFRDNPNAIHEKSCHGLSPIHLAVQNNHLKLIKALAPHYDRMTKKNKTPKPKKQNPIQQRGKTEKRKE